MYFFKKYKNRMMVAIVTIILIIIIGRTSKGRDSISKFEGFVGSVFYPVKKIGYNIGNKINDSFDFIANFRNLTRDNIQLKEEVIRLREQNKKLENIIAKSDVLMAEAKLYEGSSHQLLSAQVIGKEPGNWYHTFTIDKGLNQGVKKGATIVQGIEIDKDSVIEGLLGRVVDAGPNSSKVVSIVNEMNKVAFHIIRTQDGGILSGSKDNTMEGYLYDSKADVVVGDKLYTSGLGKVYIKDLYIGEIVEVIDAEEEMTKKIKVEPAIDFKKIYRVFAIMEE